MKQYLNWHFVVAVLIATFLIALVLGLLDNFLPASFPSLSKWWKSPAGQLGLTTSPAAPASGS